MIARIVAVVALAAGITVATASAALSAEPFCQFIPPTGHTVCIPLPAHP